MSKVLHGNSALQMTKQSAVDTSPLVDEGVSYLLSFKPLLKV